MRAVALSLSKVDKTWLPKGSAQKSFSFAWLDWKKRQGMRQGTDLPSKASNDNHKAALRTNSLP